MLVNWLWSLITSKFSFKLSSTVFLKSTGNSSNPGMYTLPTMKNPAAINALDPRLSVLNSSVLSPIVHA